MSQSTQFSHGFQLIRNGDVEIHRDYSSGGEKAKEGARVRMLGRLLLVEVIPNIVPGSPGVSSVVREKSSAPAEPRTRRHRRRHRHPARGFQSACTARRSAGGHG